jgi:ADP-ribosylation factor GTPase-activating protein 2/3
MQVGGNAAATAYFRQHGCTAKEAHQKYNSRAAQLYREKLHSLAANAQKKYGTELHLSTYPPEETMSKDEDFFSSSMTTEKTFEDLPLDMSAMSVSSAKQVTSSDISSDVIDQRQPSVHGLHSPSSTAPPVTIKPEPKTLHITKRKVPAKSGLGGARKGLGAQKIQKKFSEIEEEAEQIHRDQKAAEVLAAPMTPDGPQEIGFRETKMSDPGKARQAERLGMGVGRVGSQSHSAAASMATINQLGPVRTTQSRVDDLTAPRTSSYDHKYSSYGGNDEFFDSFYPPGYSEYGGSGNRGTSRSATSSSSNRGFGKHSAFSDSATSEPAKPSNKVSSFGSMQSGGGGGERRSGTAGGMGGAGSSRSSRSSRGAYSEEPQQRFSNAKSISSDQYFGRSSGDSVSGLTVHTALAALAGL